MRRDPREVWGDEPEEQDASAVIEEFATDERLQRRWHDHPAWVPLKVVGRFIRKSGKRIAVTVAGFAIVIVGLILVPLPGPGWLIVFAGLALLATEYVWARRLLTFAKQKVGQATDVVLRRGRRSIEFEVIDHEGTVVRGVEISTSNEHEMDRESSRIGALWVRFRERHGAVWPAFAVYDSYESDHRGPYRVVVGSPDLEEGTEAKVHAGRFARFVAHGQEPSALMDAWRRIWDATESGEFERAFTADLEIHHHDHVEILVAIR